MTDGQCACGALRLTISDSPQVTALCHCLACQRRTGAPFSAHAFYAAECVEITGTATEFVRVADSGRKVRMYFCPTCGSTVYWKAEALQALIGVAVGAFGDPTFAPPTISVFERSKHQWVELGEAIERFQGHPTG